MRNNRSTRPVPKGKQPVSGGVPWRIRAPLYLCAAGLVALYGWGAIQTYPLFFGLCLTGIFALGEFIKPAIGELLGEAIDLKAKRMSALLCVTAGAAVAIGMFGAHGALSAASAPALQYTALVQAQAAAQTALDAAQARVDGIPACTPDMPASRCRAQTAQNAGRLREAERIRDQKQERVDLAEAAVAATPNPGPGIPQEVVEAAPFGAGLVEFLLFFVPLASALLTRRRADRDSPVSEKSSTISDKKTKEKPQKAAPTAAQIAAAGWQGEAGEARRAKLAARNKARAAVH